MPTLKQLACSLELDPTGTKLKEYAHQYSDGGVEVFVVAPETDLSFHLRLTSSGYIAPGLAAWVFIDGEYQCNRNRQKLQIPRPGMDPREYEVDFRFRQKEERAHEGHFIGRDWSFAKLKTANTDMAPNTNPNFAENFGTIEVVVLRCKDASMQLPSSDQRSYIAPPGPAPPARAEVSAASSTPTHKPASKASSKVQTKVSSTKASAAGSDIIGGMFGLFDGAGDEPYYPRRVPGRVVDQSPIAGYRWDIRTGTYQYHPADDPFVHPRTWHPPANTTRTQYERDRYEQKAFTVHGGRTFSHHHPQSPPPARPTTAADRYGPATALPQGRYDFQQRRRIPLQRPPDSTRQSSQRGVGDREPPEGFPIVLDMCKQIKQIHRTTFEIRKKADSLHRQTDMYRNDPELLLAAVRALRAKEAEIQSFNEEAALLLSAIFSRMHRMDRDAWHYTRDYLVVKLRLVDQRHSELREWRDPKLRSYEPPANGPINRTEEQRDDGWQELGQGEAGLLSWDRKQQEDEQANGCHDLRPVQNSEQKKKSAGGHGNKDEWITPVDDIDQGRKPDNDRSVGEQNNQQDSPFWANDGDQNRNNDFWQNNGDQNPSKSSTSQHGGESAANNGQQDNKRDDTQTNEWGAQWGNSVQSRGHNSEAESRNGGSNTNNDQKAKSLGSQADDSRGRVRRSGSASTARLEPVIKPYWTDWNGPDGCDPKPRARARDAYQYSAPPRPAVPSGYATEANYGVAAGRGAGYAHQTFRPEYLDTMEKPYAIFTFKYRSKSALERILNRKIDTREIQKAIDEGEKDALLRMPKDELVQQLIKMKLAAPSQSASQKSPSAADERVNNDHDRAGGGGDVWGAANPKSWSASRTTDGWDKPQAQRRQKSGAAKRRHGGDGKEGWGKNDDWAGHNAGGGEWKEDKKSATPNHFEGDQNLNTTQW